MFGRLSALGVRLALDDFGTGYSALTHFRHFSVDMLKIDRSFVERLGSGDRDRDIVGAVAAMAHALGMTIVGEGIESPASSPTCSGWAATRARASCWPGPRRPRT